MSDAESKWYCYHCGSYFPALTLREDICPCGAKVDETLGMAVMPDRHQWTPPGAETCQGCNP